MRHILKDRPFIQNLVAGGLVQIIWSAASAGLSYITVHFALRSVPLWLALITGAVVFFLLSVSYYVVMAARSHDLHTEYRRTSALGSPTVAVEIDQGASQVHVGSPTRERRQIDVKLKLKFIKQIEHAASVQALHLSLIRYDSNRAEIPLIASERRLTVLDATTMQPISIDNGWVLDQPISDSRWFIFELDIAPLNQAQLSADHFLRLAISVTGQKTSWEDIRVNSWSDAQFSNSLITLKRTYLGNEQAEALLEINNNLRAEIEGLENDLIDEAKDQEEKEEALRLENRKLQRELEQRSQVDDALTKSNARINELERRLSNLQEKYDDLESDTAHVRMVAHIQAHSINSYVRIKQLRYSQHDLLRSDPYVEFSFVLGNNSIYDIEAGTTLSGSISFAKRELTGSLTWIRRDRVRHHDLGEITLRQNLTKEDVVHILNGGVTDFFHFARLNIMLAGASEFSAIVIPRALALTQTNISNSDLLTRYPKVGIQLTDVRFNWIEETRVGIQNNPRDEPCFITLFLSVTNRRPVAISVETFKLTLRLDGEEYISFAESSVFVRRFTNQLGEEIGEGSHYQNLNHQTPLTLIQDKSSEGALQFIFRDLRYLETLTNNLDLANAPIRLTLIDKDQERHTVTARLPAEGHRYVNP